MDNLFLLFSVAGVLAALLGFIAVWSPRRAWLKIAAVATVAGFLPAAYGGFAFLLSRPKPVDIEWAHRALPEATVLGQRMEEDVAIYLWLALDGVEEPRSYVLPWNQEMAKQLHEASRAAEKQGTGVRMKLPFQTSLETREKRFYAAPQEARPAKSPPGGDPDVFRRDAFPLPADRT